SPDFIMVVDQSGTIHYINRILADLTIEEMIGKPLYNFQPPESRDKYKALLAQVFQGGKMQTIEVPVTGPDGIITWYETGIVPIKDNEKVVSAMLFTKDITGRKEAQKEFDNTIAHLKKQLQRFKSND
ncbi:MAG: PAS domain-containing protein, partial [bacterium]